MPKVFSHALVLITVFLSSFRSCNIHILALQKTEMERLRKMKKEVAAAVPALLAICG